MNDILRKYARLLTHYCLGVRPGDHIFISTTVLAEPLVREVYRESLEAGAALVECDLSFRERERMLLQYGSEEAIRRPSAFAELAIGTFDAYLNIRAPFNLRELQNASPERQKVRQEALQAVTKVYYERIADRRLRRNLCQYPTDAAAQEAGMSLSEYENFVYQACKLSEPDPVEAWLNVRAEQQRIVDYLNQCSTIRYVNPNTDISFSTSGRTWINSDGQNNMPSGEVFTSPVENSVQGVIYFSYPAVYQGHEVLGVTLWVKDGYIEKWEARQGKDFLDYIFTLPGTRRFGEAAIGTNYSIRQMTKNILFDEKIGGTIHMAIGQSYLQCGGKNESPIHWDLITDMTSEGEIWADGECIYRNGHFLI
ncbi:MAG: aminopeptidase [Saprospiraceae bacterium]|nr:aminopeptidase [Saprospiraceae bacterium]MDW8483607.1 aminopeptidase [Saprospiraceae bacterium]